MAVQGWLAYYPAAGRRHSLSTPPRFPNGARYDALRHTRTPNRGTAISHPPYILLCTATLRPMYVALELHS